MPIVLKLQPHKSIEDLEQPYRQSSDRIEHTQFQIAWLLAKGHKISEASEVKGYS